MYEVAITNFRPQPTQQKLSFAEAAGASACVRLVEDDVAVISIADIRDRTDYGNFYIWIYAGRALVRLDEHREHFACNQEAALDLSPEQVVFQDEDGSRFSMPVAATVNVHSAKEALLHWLATGKRSAALAWS